jgi:excisionase family DNA binding protein
MSEKLMTLRELCEYLGAHEERIISLVEEKAIPAYKIGGELLRFRKEQIETMRSEIDSRLRETEGPAALSGKKTPVKPAERPGISRNIAVGNTFSESLRDFLYFNDFYILSAVISVVLLVIIFRG